MTNDNALNNISYEKRYHSDCSKIYRFGFIHVLRGHICGAIREEVKCTNAACIGPFEYRPLVHHHRLVRRSSLFPF